MIVGNLNHSISILLISPHTMKILSAEFISSAVGPKQFPADKRPQIAFAGRSNVGKSSLINALVHRKNLVKTSATPGKTQMVNFFLVNKEFYFVDLPGYGYARVPKGVTDSWAQMIESYLKNSSDLRAVVVLLDIRRRPDERDRRLFEWLAHYNIPAIPVMTKADKLKRQEADRARREIVASLDAPASEAPIQTSCRNGQGMDVLWRAIRMRIQEDPVRT